MGKYYYSERYEMKKKKGRNKYIALLRNYGGKANYYDKNGEYVGKGKGDLNDWTREWNKHIINERQWQLKPSSLKIIKLNSKCYSAVKTKFSKIFSIYYEIIKYTHTWFLFSYYKHIFFQGTRQHKKYCLEVLQANIFIHFYIQTTLIAFQNNGVRCNATDNCTLMGSDSSCMQACMFASSL